MKQSMRRTFVAGLVITLPLLITVWIIQFIFSRIDSAVSPVVVKLIRLLGLSRWLEVAWLDYVSPLVAVALGVIAIYLVGLVGGNVLGRQVLKGLERLVMQIPLVRSIYSATRQFFDTFSKASSRSFRRVVLVQYPRQGLWTLGLVTNSAVTDIQTRTHPSVVAVFLPTTPNPTSGWLVFVPNEELIEVSMTVDDAFKMIISGGVLSGAAAPPSSP